MTGTVVDPKGGVVAGASVVAHNRQSRAALRVVSSGQGKFSFSGLAAGSYTVEAEAPGFDAARTTTVDISQGQAQDITLSLTIGNVSQQVTVEADDTQSTASRLSPLDALLNETSPRSEIGATYIRNYAAPTADYGELTQMVPGAFTTNTNGVGLGQSSTNFRGFSDGSYDIDFDGIPFYDTNTPSHHSWAFFPAQWVGGIDFDRSPGTASTIGPTPFGGSIHLLSQELSAARNIRGTVSYGSFNTFLFDGAFDSGDFGGANKKSNIFVDVHHMSSDGYQTFNYQTRNAGSLKYQYKWSDKTVLTGYAGVIWLDANTPNLSSTRQQLLTYGDNYLLQNTDNTQANYYKYNTYHVPTDFEYVGVNHQFAHNWLLSLKGYTYNYDNSEFYAKQPKGGKPINQANCLPVASTVTEGGVKVPVSISPCAVDKYNSYRKFGETAAISQASKYGVFRTGLWYEWARTNRHQVPSNPFTQADDTLPNFSESYYTNSYQPYAEYEFHVIPRLTIIPGVKFAYYTMDFTQYADNGGKIGSINPITQKPFTSVTNSVDYNSWLPALSLSYRLKPNWSVYGQGAKGSVVPPTSVFDVAGGVVAVPPKPQKSTTYQVGTVLKLNRISFDADYYHIRFQNGYSSVTDNNASSATYGESINYISPSSVSQGFEAQGNVYILGGLSVFLNGSRGQAQYVGTLSTSCVSGTAGCTSTSPQLTVRSPSGLWVSGTPTDTEAEGVTWAEKGFNLGFFNKRVGSQWMDNGAYHNQLQVPAFSSSNIYLNYTIRTGSRLERFNGTKIRLSINNLADSHNQTSISAGGALINQNVASNGLTYVDPFKASTTTSAGLPQGYNLADNPSLMAGRSVMLSVTFGLSPKR
ncbi:MAG: TonB-dependent receptor [Edaphobacter sp.]|uniref:TonB-dependent receptor n=1 Tax=Edaphobacter sp. TaxID=1934404 RepID=UPI002398E874|nr:TonB-dependent receptor [Edaphobacter sp.]MDE1178266.1 TonB-dependent receptor [Edaphobacter sp.]